MLWIAVRRHVCGVGMAGWETGARMMGYRKVLKPAQQGGRGAQAGKREDYEERRRHTEKCLESMSSRHKLILLAA